MASMFESYEKEVRGLIDGITKRLTRLAALTGESRKDTIRQAENDFKEGDEMIDQMRLEARGAPAAVKSGMMKRVGELSLELSKLKADLKKAEVAYTTASQRNDLFAGVGGDAEVTAYDQRQRLLGQGERLQAVTGRITDSHRVALETEDLGRSILTTMQGQREQIIHARDTIRQTDDNISRARSTLRSIGRRITTNKCIMVLIIIVLLGIIGVIIYFAIPKPTPTPPTPNLTSIAQPALRVLRLWDLPERPPQ